MENLFSDLCDGRRLLELLEGLTGHELVQRNPHTRVQTLPFFVAWLFETLEDAPEQGLGSRQYSPRSAPSVFVCR